MPAGWPHGGCGRMYRSRAHPENGDGRLQLYRGVHAALVTDMVCFPPAWNVRGASFHTNFKEVEMAIKIGINGWAGSAGTYFARWADPAFYGYRSGGHQWSIINPDPVGPNTTLSAGRASEDIKVGENGRRDGQGNSYQPSHPANPGGFWGRVCWNAPPPRLRRRRCS